ncbi:MAG: 3-dehydroquinate synthase [Candidatus Neptunochlamydia sp.]|nr:3-dehydroquinate synthase [Candidatus Neptunochlamydia sp.]
MKTVNPPIYFEKDLLSNEAFIKLLQKHSGRFTLVADEKVASLYGKPFLTFMKRQDFECHLVTFQGGEKSKTRKTKEEIENQLLAQKLGRDTLLIVMGGGVTTDIGGFVASTYLRGVPYISVPTSLLAMVDASIGGKTGVNVKGGKNMIGSIYSPLAIFMDFSMLSTLPDSEILCGSAEILKAGLIADKHLFEELEEKIGHWKERNLDFLKRLISQSVKIKKKVIERDLKESGERHILNFGHTIGHAIEALEGYTLSHGEAVAIGMVVEAFIAHKMQTLTESDFNAIYQLVRKMGFTLEISEKATTATMKERMMRDKKAKEATPRFVILDGIGKVHRFKGSYCSTLDSEILDEALGWMVAEFQR